MWNWFKKMEFFRNERIARQIIAEQVNKQIREAVAGAYKQASADMSLQWMSRAHDLARTELHEFLRSEEFVQLVVDKKIERLGVSSDEEAAILANADLNSLKLEQMAREVMEGELRPIVEQMIGEYFDGKRFRLKAQLEMIRKSRPGPHAEEQEIEP